MKLIKLIKKFIRTNKQYKPFYIINLKKIIKIYKKWLSYLPLVKPYYAVKCNNNKKILKLLSDLGCSFDCASKEEIKTILNITNDPSRIIFANPCKIPSHIKYASNNDVDYMTFDCEEELYKIKKYHPNSKLILRIAVDDSYSICKFNIKFGCRLEDVNKLIKIMKNLDLNLSGFSFHVGSGCNSDIIYYDALKSCREAFDIAVSNNYNHNIDIIDIGGGFQDNNNFINITMNINKGLNDFFKYEIDNNIINVIAEPGRFFVEKSHTLVLNVIGKKKSDNEFKYYLNDGVYGSFNCIIFDHKIPTIKSLHKPNPSTEEYISKFFGPTCDSIDLIADNIKFHELNIGDYIYIPNFGAYTYSASSSFNGFKTKSFKYYI